jgi:hypothetical protein
MSTFCVKARLFSDKVVFKIKIADTCVFVVSMDKCIDDMGYAIYESIFSCHLPANLFVVQVCMLVFQIESMIQFREIAFPKGTQ